MSIDHLVCRLYDPKKPDVTRNKMEFKLKIQQYCTDDKLYYKYRKDRREVLDLSAIKGGEYKAKKALELELLKLKMRMQLYGAQSLTKKERAKLRKAGIIPKRATRV